MSSPQERRPGPYPVDYEIVKPPGILRPAAEIAGAAIVVTRDLNYWEKEVTRHGLDESWINGIKHPKWSNIPETIREGLKTHRSVSRRDGLSYALGGSPSRYFSEISPFVQAQITTGAVAEDVTTRTVDEVKVAKEVISKGIAESIEGQIAAETLRLYTAELESEGTMDVFFNIAKLLRFEQQKGKLEALAYVLGKDNVIADIVRQRKK